MTAPGEGWPTTPADVIAWLRALPAAERWRVAGLLVDRHVTEAAIGLERAGAVHELTRTATWEVVAEQLGTSTANVNKLVTRYRGALARGECIACGGPGPADDMCDVCAASVVLDPPHGEEQEETSDAPGT
ncbi:hypothetical protein Drose_06070 [Dactylosporangium roseum]|uniref:Uncharacterized protein n=1 Tax=Dactylosporangium roseum TaxID=47989 RepID=A0ABY5Z711_9ACTN|nr:hypothetical protein [Dactylosporangium roseum]UWZ37838.1 hypothetical protein Drose_06070 [Dactylosporangium roseum]